MKPYPRSSDVGLADPSLRRPFYTCIAGGERWVVGRFPLSFESSGSSISEEEGESKFEVGYEYVT